MNLLRVTGTFSWVIDASRLVAYLVLIRFVCLLYIMIILFCSDTSISIEKYILSLVFYHAFSYIFPLLNFVYIFQVSCNLFCPNLMFIVVADEKLGILFGTYFEEHQ